MNHTPKPDTANAIFTDGLLTVRLSFPAEEAPAWRSATPQQILEHLGLPIQAAPPSPFR